MPLRVGLTGGIASGKTTVCDLFAALGATVIDADLITHELMLPGMVVHKQIIEAFGVDILDVHRAIDRTRLGALVFSQPERRRELEAIIHPNVKRVMREQVRACTGPYCLLAVPLLVETGMHADVDRVLVIDLPTELQRERLKQRNGFDDTRIDQILNAQTSREERLRFADDIIDNSGPLQALKPQVVSLDHQYRTMESLQDD